MSTIEPILDESNRRYTMFPIQYQSIWNLYKVQQSCFWKAEEIDFSKDYDDFLTLSVNEQLYIKRVLAFFAASDGIVNLNLSSRFLNDVKIMEGITCYSFQMMMEGVHCVSGDTNILTDKGYLKIKSLLDQSVKVWNGNEFSETIVKYTGDSRLIRVKLSNGMELDCTPDHKWFIRSGDCEKIKKITSDLKLGDVVYDYTLPVLEKEDPDEFKNPYIHGFFCGDGNDYKINKDKFVVPINYSVDVKLRWLEGFCDSDGCINFINQDFIKNIQLLLTTLGVNSNIEKGGEEMYTLYITCDSIKKLVSLGFNPKSLKIKVIEKPDLLRVESIEELDGVHETFCFSEEKEHAGIFNGILTSQSEVYSLMLDNIIRDSQEKDIMFKAIESIDSIGVLADWAFKWIESDLSYAHRVVAFVTVEGLMFSGAFASIYWIKAYLGNILQGLTKSNEFIARDESQHVFLGIELYKLLNNKLTVDKVFEIIDSGLKISKNFMTDALPIRLLGMNSESMCDYLEYVADRLFVDLGYEKQYNKANPFEFMKNIGMQTKTNMFESRVMEYSSAYAPGREKKELETFEDDF